jgi:HD superfamily phosphohydrolase
MIEEKGIYSIEKFLVSRRLMYWQVYLHKTVLSAETMLVNIIKRAKLINASAPSEVLNIFLSDAYKQDAIEKFLVEFCLLDDYDILSAIKHWATHQDKILSYLCSSLINRNLLKVKFFASPAPPELQQKKLDEVCHQLGLNKEEAAYIVFTGETENRTYNSLDERIHILFKDKTVKDISMVDNALINQTLFDTVKKFYICYKG